MKPSGLNWVEAAGADQYRVTRPTSWEVGKKGSGLFVQVPAGFQFESSIPRLLHWLVSPHDERLLWSAAIHDWLLENGYGAIFSAGEWYSGALKYRVPPRRAFSMCISIVVYTAARRIGSP